MVDENSRLLERVRAMAIRPAEAKRIVAQYQRQSVGAHRSETDRQHQERIADEIIARYARLAAIAGGSTSLTGVVPGLGTFVAATGGAVLNATLCIKLQVDMCFCLAEAFKYDITSSDTRNLATLVAAGAILGKADAEGVVEFVSQAGVRLVKQQVKRAALQIAKKLFAKVAVVLAGEAVAKSLPFGLGVIVGSHTSFARTKRTGQQAKEWFLLDRTLIQGMTNYAIQAPVELLNE